jgi:FkbM family methyltransferase
MVVQPLSPMASLATRFGRIDVEFGVLKGRIMGEVHPSPQARVARALRGMAVVRGWRRVASKLAGDAGNFRVSNQGVWLEGGIDSYVERQAYLFGGYERREIELFLAAIPADRRRTILDIGANIGTHSLSFAKAFANVHAFEPNPLVVDRLRRNVALNRAENIEVHQVGLSDVAGTLDLYAPDSANQGLGTFLEAEQYDRALVRVGSAEIAVGDAYVANLAGGATIDAIKCDVQGFEVPVFRGLAETIMRDRPIIWVEIGSGAHTVEQEIRQLLPLLPKPARYLRMSAAHSGPFTRSILVETTEQDLAAGDYIVMPL